MLGVADIVDLELQLRRDEGAERAAHERDRAIAQRLRLEGEADESLVRAWLAEIRRGPGPWPGRRVQAGLARLRGGLVVAGLVVGAGAALAAFAYDGSTPINVVRAWALLAGIQILLLVITLTTLLAMALRRAPSAREPGFAVGLFETVSSWLPAKDPTRTREQLHLLLTRSGRYRVLVRWLVVECFQIAAGAAAVAMLAVILLRVTGANLAFCWETTLSWPPADFYRVSTWIAWPWAAVVPEAVPAADLVARTLYSPFAKAYVGGAPSAAFDSRAWWPFLFMSVVAYGLIPRLALLAAARLRVLGEQSRAFRRSGDYYFLTQRLREAVLRTYPSSPAAPASSAADLLPDGELPSAPVGEIRAVILWALGPSELSAATIGTLLRREPPAVHAAGGYDPANEGRVIEDVASTGSGGVVVMTPAWDHASTALKDFLRELRARLGDGTPVTVTPIDEDGRGGWAAAPERVRRVWARDLADLRDSWVRVAAP